MSARAQVTFVAGACAILLGLLLPFAELGLQVTPLSVIALGLPWVALVIAAARPAPLASHGIFPASFLVAAVHLPDLFGPRVYAGLGGALSLVALLGAGAIYLSASRGEAPLKAGADRPPRTPPILRARLALWLTVATLLLPLAALWIPLLNRDTPSAGLALGALMSAIWVLALTLAVDRLGVLSAPLEPHREPERVAALRLRLQRRRSQTKLGVALGALMGLAGLSWYLLRGLS